MPSDGGKRGLKNKVSLPCHYRSYDAVECSQLANQGQQGRSVDRTHHRYAFQCLGRIRTCKDTGTHHDIKAHYEKSFTAKKNSSDIFL